MTLVLLGLTCFAALNTAVRPTQYGNYIVTFGLRVRALGGNIDNHFLPCTVAAICSLDSGRRPRALFFLTQLAQPQTQNRQSTTVGRASMHRWTEWCDMVGTTSTSRCAPRTSYFTVNVRLVKFATLVAEASWRGKTNQQNHIVEPTFPCSPQKAQKTEFPHTLP